MLNTQYLWMYILWYITEASSTTICKVSTNQMQLQTIFQTDCDLYLPLTHIDYHEPIARLVSRWQWATNTCICMISTWVYMCFAVFNGFQTHYIDSSRPFPGRRSFKGTKGSAKHKSRLLIERIVCSSNFRTMLKDSETFSGRFFPIFVSFRDACGLYD